MKVLIFTIRFTIRFILTLVIFPVVWIFAGIYCYLRLLVTLERLSVDFDFEEPLEVYEHDFED